MAVKFYSIDQTPPPAHWYQKRVGWFGKSFAAFLFLVVAGFGISGYMVIQGDVKSLASAKSQPKLNKVTAVPLAEPKAENIIELQPLLDQWVAENPSEEWGVVIKGVDGPAMTGSLNADKEFRSASIYKLFLVMPLFAQIPVEHQPGIMMNIDGQQRSMATCVDLMLRLSHNACGEAIGDYLNWTKAQKSLNAAGFQHTKFGADELLTSASDTVSFLDQLNKEMLNRTAKDTVLRSLREQRWRAGIPAGCPGCITANKTGDFEGVTHDAAIVQYKGGTYILAIFSEGGTFKQISELTGRIQQKILDTTSN